ncbi:sensor histidine kinase [Chryseobacterium taeanense]|uniref:sensor histidine kinase n=1 Tax=Chryseobacterium taeanense TaxID=311334 RepID=UPI0035B2AD14
MKRSLRWIYPFFLGLILFNTLRMVTDFTNREVFWAGSMRLHLIALVFTITLCYFYDFLWRRQLVHCESRYGRSPLQEYLMVLLQLSFINLILPAGEYIGIFFMGNGWIDYMLINVCFLPILLIYYTIIRNEIFYIKYSEKELMLEKAKADQSEAELKFLKSQYHPHFLFNALNTVYFQIDEHNEDAKKSIEILSGLLRYQLYDIEKEVTLEQEISYLKDYIAFQKIRMSERLILETSFGTPVKDTQIHPLLFQPMVENAFKYVGGRYRIKLELKMENTNVKFEIQNTISETEMLAPAFISGIGLDNLRRRLDLLYPNKYELETDRKADVFCTRLMIKTK